MDISKITPQNDVLFKMIFANPKHERVLLHFLNSAIDSKEPINKVKIINNEIAKQSVDEKGSRLDVLAETNSGELIDIEIQIGIDLHMVGRTLFYWSKLFAGQLVVGEQYRALRRTISINILNFKLFKQDDRYWRRCHVADDTTHEKITDLLEIQFLELNKLKQFNKESPITFWIEFFKNPYSEACAELYKVVPELKEAKEIFEQAKADPEKRRIIEEREDAVRNYASALSSAREDGLQEGLQQGKKEGMQQGLERGREEGLEQGKTSEQKRIVTNLLQAGFTAEQVANMVGIAIEKIDRTL